MIRELGRRCLRRPRLTIAAWLVCVAGLGVVGLGVEERLAEPTFLLEGSESYRALQARDEHFGSSNTFVLMLRGPRGALEREGDRVSRSLRRHGYRVLSPWSGGQDLELLRPRERAALVVITSTRPVSEAMADVGRVRRISSSAVGPPVRTSLTGQNVIGEGLNDASLESTKKGEQLAIPILLLVLLLVFRSPAAALLPAVLGGATVLAGSGLLSLLSSITTIDGFATTFSAMMGLALGVDYSLLLVARCREELGEGVDLQTAAERALRHGGHTILSAAGALLAAMAVAALLVPDGLLFSSLVAIAAVTAFAALSAVTVLPCALLVVGPWLDRWRLGRPDERGERSWSAAAAARLMRRPALAVAILGLALLALGVPARTIDAGPPGVDLLPADSEARRDYDRVGSVAGKGWGGPFEITVVSHDRPVTERPTLVQIDELERRIRRDPQVIAVTGAGTVRQATTRIQRAVSRLDDSRSALGSSRRELVRFAGALSETSRGAALVRDGIGQAQGGAQDLSRGTAEVRGGAERLASGTARLASGQARLRQAAPRLSRGVTSLERGVGSAARGVRELEEGLARAESRLRASLAQTPSAADRLSEAAGGLRALTDPVRQAEQSVAAAARQLRRSLGGAVEPSTRQALVEVLKAQAALTGRDPRDGKPVEAGYDGVQKELEGAASQLASASDEARAATAQLESLRSGLQRLREGARRLGSGVAEARAGAARLSRAVAELGGGQERVGEELERVREGAAALSGGLNELLSGTRRFERELRGGRSGTSRLHDGISRLGDRVQRNRRDLSQLDAPDTSGRSTPFRSSYFTLATLDRTRPRDRLRASYVVSLDRGGRAARVMVIPREGPGDDSTGALYDRLRGEADRVAQRPQTAAFVGGDAAEILDFQRFLTSRLLLLILALAAGSFVVLTIIFRSVALAAVAVLLNLVTTAAAFGVLVIAFQGSAPLGGPGYIDALSLVGIFFIAFALSLDYEVFLVSRMRERFQESGDTRDAVLFGLRRTAQVVTGAALIMIAVFLAFAVSDFATVRQFGVGLAVAVALDALVVRLLLLPCLIVLLGSRAWRLPDRMVRPAAAVRS